MPVAAGTSTEGTYLIPDCVWSLVLYEGLMISTQTISSCVHPAFRWKHSKEETSMFIFIILLGCWRGRWWFLLWKFMLLSWKPVVDDSSVLKTEAIHVQKLEKDDKFWGVERGRLEVLSFLQNAGWTAELLHAIWYYSGEATMQHTPLGIIRGTSCRCPSAEEQR